MEEEEQVQSKGVYQETTLLIEFVSIQHVSSGVIESSEQEKICTKNNLEVETVEHYTKKRHTYLGIFNFGGLFTAFLPFICK
jgi:hypothetical protein